MKEVGYMGMLVYSAHYADLFDGVCLAFFAFGGGVRSCTVQILAAVLAVAQLQAHLLLLCCSSAGP